MSTPDPYAELIEHLRMLGHTPAEIELVLEQVREYDLETHQDSLMDLIGRGDIDLGAILKSISPAEGSA